jgi:thiosulfate/3-mercaptopyruvate sulfurtransferase
MGLRDAEFARPDYLIDTAWLAAHLDDPAVRIIDCTVDLSVSPEKYTIVSGRAAYDKEHIPGALFADVIEEFAAPGSRFFFTLPTAERFADVMSALGLRNDQRFVLYSTTTYTWATRFFWMLRAFGHDRAALLDGGWKKWKGEARAVTANVTPRSSSSFVAVRQHGVFVDTSEVEAAIGDDKTAIVCALGRPQFTGEKPSYLSHHGRIPGAKHLAAISLLDPEDGTLLPPDALREKVAGAALLDASRVIAYCGAGIAATGDAFALALLGHPNVAVYDGSMQEWFDNPRRPVERDAT